MKKLIAFVLAVISTVSLFGCAAVISHPKEAAVRICYDRENVSFDLELSQEETNVVLSVLNGKRRDRF